jgi:hypothetical protein
VPGLQTSDGQKQPVFRKEAAFRTKNPNRKWPILMCIALSTKIHNITDVSCRLLFNNPAAKDYEGVGSRRPGERSESMLHSFSCFASSAPLSSAVLGPP